MTPDKNAPMAVYLSSDAAKDVTGQVFGTPDERDDPVQFAAADPHHAPRRRLDAGNHRRARIPALKAAFMPLDRSGEVFSWDPVYGQRTSGGRLMRIASTLPPVFRPNSVPRSWIRLNSTYRPRRIN